MMRQIPQLLTVAAVTLAGLAVGLGAASAGTDVLHSVGLARQPGGRVQVTPSHQYAKNQAGMTYGSDLDAAAPAGEPDLISAVATNGKTGYVKKAELNKANGQDALNTFKSPQDAIAWQNSLTAQQDQTIAVYDQDGATVIGQFVITGHQNQHTPK
jgi:hypothetical protein